MTEPEHTSAHEPRLSTLGKLMPAPARRGTTLGQIVKNSTNLIQRQTHPLGRADPADLSSFAGMLAAYIDLPGLGVPKIGPFGPFVRAALGAHPDRADHHDVSGDDDHRPGASRTGFAWMVTAGAAVALGELVTVDLAWPTSGPSIPVEVRVG